jgi:hypothetical protein
MLAGFPMKFLHFKQFDDHMNVEYGNGLSLIVVTHAVASLSTRLRHSKVKVLGNGHLAMSSTEKTKKTTNSGFLWTFKKTTNSYGKFLCPLEKNNEFL